MKALKSVKKLPSIDNPKLVKRLKPSSNNNKKQKVNAEKLKVLMTTSVTTSTVSGLREETVESTPTTETSKVKVKSKSNPSSLNSSSLILSYCNLNQSAVSVSWKDSLRDFRKTTLPTLPKMNLSTRKTPEKDVTRPASSRGSARTRLQTPRLTPARSSARLKVKEAKEFPAVTPAVNLDVSAVREFRFSQSSSSTTSKSLVSMKSDSRLSQLPRPRKDPAESSYLTPLARSLRAPADSSISRSNSTSREETRRHNCSNISITEEKASPKNQSRQRGVVLPLLQEKDQTILQLERKLERLEHQHNLQVDEGKKMKEENEKLMTENDDLKGEKSVLEDNFEKLRKDFEESQDKLYSLEMKNLAILDALVAERAQGEALQSEVTRLSSGEHRDQEDLSKSDLTSLVESFLEKVSIICRNENLRFENTSENGNVKLKLKTKKMSSRDNSSLESTHLCEDSARCNSISTDLASKLGEDESEESDKQKVFDKVKVIAENDTDTKKEDLNMGLTKLSLADKKIETLKATSRVRTRSMSRKRNVQN